MTKKQTAKQKQIAALQQRLHDIYSGVLGRYETWMEDFYVSPSDLAKIYRVVTEIFKDEKIEDFVWANHNLGYWENPEKLAEFLHRYGVRA